MKETLDRFTITIEDIRQSRSTVLSCNDISEKFAILNVAVYECVSKILKLVELCDLIKCHQKKPEFLQWMRQEIDQSVEGCPTDPKSEDIMKLPLQYDMDPDLVDDNMRV